VKAAVYDETGPPEVLRYADVPDPTPGPGEVLISVEAISIEGGDTLNRAGGVMPASPHIVGYQCAGTVAALGDGVTDRSVGQRVVATMAWGSHAELAVTAPQFGAGWTDPLQRDAMRSRVGGRTLEMHDQCGARVKRGK